MLNLFQWCQASWRLVDATSIIRISMLISRVALCVSGRRWTKPTGSWPYFSTQTSVWRQAAKMPSRPWWTLAPRYSRTSSRVAETSFPVLLPSSERASELLSKSRGGGVGGWGSAIFFIHDRKPPWMCHNYFHVSKVDFCYVISVNIELKPNYYACWHVKLSIHFI